MLDIEHIEQVEMEIKATPYQWIPLDTEIEALRSLQGWIADYLQHVFERKRKEGIK